MANGGLGIRRLSDTALPAFLSSVTGSHTLITELLPQRLHTTSVTKDPTTSAAVNAWQTRACYAPVQSAFPAAQKVWDTPLMTVQEVKVLSAAPDQVSKTRLIAVVAPLSGAFLNVRPCGSLGNRLDSSSLPTAVALQLDAPICLPHACVSETAVDNTGTQGLSCRKSAGRLSRHSADKDFTKTSTAVG